MENDIELPVPEADTTVLPDAASVKELFDECEKTAEDYRGRYLPQALYNERMCEGEQFIDLNASWEIIPSDWPEYVPKAARNLLRNLRLTWSSRILEDRPFVRAYPAEPGADELKAKIANRYLEYFRQRIDFDDLCFRAAQLVQPHSAVAFKVVWDPLIGPPSQGVTDPETGEVTGAGEREGDVAIDLVSIFDYYTDGAEEIEDSKWVVFQKWMSPHDAGALLRSAGVPMESLQVEEYVDHWGVKHKGVKVSELWWKPDYRFTEGLYAVMVGDVAVQAGPFPYEHGELPIAVWKCNPRRSSPYGSTHVDDAVYIQKVINETVAAIWQQARMIGSVKLLAHPNVVEQWEHGHQLLKMQDMTLAQYVRYLEPPNRSAVLVETLEDSTEAIYSIYGLNEMLTGAENVKSGTSARSIAYLNKLDSMKMAGASRSLGKAITRTMRQALKLVQQYVVAERIAMVAGDTTGLGPLIYTGADIGGVDVILEQASAIERYRGTLVGDAQAAMQQGSQDPSLPGTVETGLKDSAYTKSQQDIVMAQVDAVNKGQPQQPTPEVDAEIAVPLLTQLVGLFPQGSQQQQVMLQLLQGYRETQAQQQQQEATASAGPPQSGGGNAPVPR